MNVSQSSSPHQDVYYYSLSAKLSTHELQTLHNIQDQIRSPLKIIELLDQPGVINNFMEDIQKIDDRLEDLKIEDLPADSDQPDNIEKFTDTIDAIREDIGEAIKQFMLAVGNTKEIKLSREHPQKGEEDAKKIEENKNLFIDHIKFCRKLLNHAEKIATELGVADAVKQKSAEKKIRRL
jgi:hypothetical protein